MKAGMKSVVSCGVLIVDPDGEMLLCHATGTPRWDIPKGLADEGEHEREAAVREVMEETGLELPAAELIDLGRHTYLRGKDLHLFALQVPRFDTASCRCISTFTDFRGHTRPEVDAWEWVAFDAAPERCGKNMARVLRTLLPVAQAALNPG